jgi:hypothetical protein
MLQKLIVEPNCRSEKVSFLVKLNDKSVVKKKTFFSIPTKFLKFPKLEIKIDFS